MRNFLDILAENLAAGHCQALVIGGFALEAYGHQRPTHDIDLLVSTSHTENVHALLLAAGYREAGRNPICARYLHPDPMLFPVDLLFINDSTWQKMQAASETSVIQGLRLQVPAPAHTVALKLHAMTNDPLGRHNDFGDIVRILSLRPEAWTHAELKSLCARYAPPGVHDQILTALRHGT